MKNVMVHLKSLALAAGVVTATHSVAATLPERPVPDSAVQTCTSRIAEEVNFSDATHVRHVVDARSRRAIGYKLTVETTVRGKQNASPLRQYSAVCVVTPGDKLYRFRINSRGEEQVASGS